ncbi:hypothetical protein ACFXKF_34930 [Streptomyces scopuliridis]|uniref:hypothetical protein n=1 Tax=Streptomyces scopuliridis TaxID=452529 RepID=UPI0036CABC11
MLGLRDDLYRRIGAPEGYRPFGMETEDGATHVVWYRLIHYEPPKPASRPSWLHGLLGGNTAEDENTEISEATENPENTGRPA